MHEPTDKNSQTSKRPKFRPVVFLYRYGVVFALLAFVVGFGIATPGTFLSFATITTILNSQSVFMILALGLTLALAAGDFDLSIGAVLGFTNVLVGYLTVLMGWPLAVAIAAALLGGVIIGLANGILVVRFRINAFIATLGTGTILGGLTLILTNGRVVTDIPVELTGIMRHQVFGLPLPVYGGLALAVLLWYLYEHTPLGRYLMFTGEAREAARLTGLPVDRIRLLAFVGCSVMAALAGIVALGQLGFGDPSLGPNYLLPAYAAAFLGSTTIKPGRFNAWGTVVALYLLVVGITGLQLLGAESWVQYVFNGGALIVSLLAAQWAAKKAPDIAYG